MTNDDDLKIIRDEAYTPDEFARLERERERNRRRRRDPGYRAQDRERQRKYREANREKLRTYHRDWMRAKRERQYQERQRNAAQPVTASLHGLRCPYPTEPCRCRKILVVEPWQ